MNKSSSSGQICQPQLKSKSNPTAISQLKSILALTGQWKKSRKKVAMRKNRIFPFSVSVNRIFFTFPFLFRQKFLCSCTGAMGTVIRGENKKEKVVKKRWQHQTKITHTTKSILATAREKRISIDRFRFRFCCCCLSRKKEGGF